MTCIVEVHSYNILLMLPFGAKSHKNVFDPIAEELGKRGHQITMMSSIKDTAQVKGVTNVHLELAEKVFSNESFSFFRGTVEDKEFMDGFTEMLVQLCNTTYNEAAVQEIIKNPRHPNNPDRPRYDLVIVDLSANDFVLPLAHLMGVPAVYISSSIMFSATAWSLNIPLPYSYIPSGLNTFSAEMTMIERGLNAYLSFSFKQIMHANLFPRYDELIHKYFLPNAPSIRDLERKVSFAMTHTHPALFPIRPSMPYTAEIACAHCRPGKKLPKDLDDYMNNSENGVIYFSIGSHTRGVLIPEDMKGKLLKAFSQVPYNVLFKFEEEIPNLPSNIKLVHWAPQQDILAHPKLRLFISHCGGLSTLESAYHAVPVLGFPLSADQWGNTRITMDKGFGDILDWRKFATEDLISKIRNLIENKSFKENASKMSILLKDYIQHPAERAAYWVEYVIRHKGAPHLKSAADELNFFQYFLLDVIGLFLVLILIFIFVGYLIIKAFFRLVFKRDNKKKFKKQ